jgi:hypothetical protein
MPGLASGTVRLAALSAHRPDQFNRLSLAGYAGASGGYVRRRFVVISRGLTRYRHFDLSNLTATERLGALRLQLQAWMPFAASHLHVVLKGRSAMAFAWDAQSAEAALTAADAPLGIPCIPEGLLRPPAADGLRCLSVLDGFEAQVWRAGVLEQSQWWRQIPDAPAWEAFLSTCPPRVEVPDDLASPTPQALGWLRRPWAQGTTPDELGKGASRWERLALLATVLGLAMGGGATARQWFEASSALESARQAQSRLDSEAGPQLAARTAALAAADQLDRQVRALVGHQPLELLEVLARSLPAKGAVLTDFSYDAGRLRLSLALGPGVTRTVVVEQLQAAGIFQDITEVREASAQPGVLSLEVSVSTRALAEQLDKRPARADEVGAVGAAAAASAVSGRAP